MPCRTDDQPIKKMLRAQEEGVMIGNTDWSIIEDLEVSGAVSGRMVSGEGLQMILEGCLQ